MADTGKTIGLIKALASVDPEAIKSSVDDWLDDHPEATTTVEDGAITKAKLDSSLQQTVDDVGDLKSAIGTYGYFAPSAYTGDLNDIKVGWSRYAVSATNAPSDEGGWVITLERAVNSKRQIAVSETGRLFTRRMDNASWLAWGEYARNASVESLADTVNRLIDENFKEVWKDLSDQFEAGIITTNVTAGTVVDTTRSTATAYMSAIIPCTKYEYFKITGTGGNSGRLWAFCNTEYKLISKSAGYVTETNLELQAPADGYLIVNAGWETKQLYKKVLQIVLPDEITKSGGNWSSDVVPDHGITTEYESIAEYNPTLTELYALYDALVTAHPNYITKSDLGTDQSGEYHLYKYSFVPESITVTGSEVFSIPSMPKILLGSGTHGNGQDAGDEPEMVVGVYYLLKNICDNWYGNEALTYLRHHVRIELIPVQNPWGYVNESRRNSRQVDINRNFPFGWQEGTPGTDTYGGTEPLSEAESVIIKNFIDANTDALFYFDLHTTGGTQTQDKMIYYSMMPNKNLIVPANDTVIYLSDKWNHENIANLDTTIMHGYINSVRTIGSGSIYQYANSVKGIPACVMEAFPNFANSGLSDNSELVMRMCQEELVTFIVKCLRYFKFNYLSNQKS